MTSKKQIKSATPTLALVALVLAGFAFLPKMQAACPVEIVGPGPDGCYAGFNTAEGCSALCGNTGAGNTAVGWQSLNFSASTNFNTAVGAATLAINSGTAPSADGNTAIGCAAMVLNFSGIVNTATGVDALIFNSSGSFNSAYGGFALLNNFFGNFNTAVGESALITNNITGGTGGDSNTAVGASALFANDDGSHNTAVGDLALTSNLVGDAIVGGNTAVGDSALMGSVTSTGNTAVGTSALLSNDLGGGTGAFANTGVGAFALTANIAGAGNSAFGFDAGLNLGGFANTVVGAMSPGAIGITTGFLNTTVGTDAGDNIGVGFLNTFLGNLAGGITGDVGGGFSDIYIGESEDNPTGVSEFSTIRIGDNLPSGGISITDPASLPLGFPLITIGDLISTPLSFSQCLIGGIWDQFTFDFASTMPVMIDHFGALGTMASTRSVKRDIKPMDTASEAILALEPVTFHYKSDKTNTPFFGLIAEDVAAVNPDLVVRDKEGKPQSVRYDQINAMLLNEFLKEHKKVEEQQASIAELKSTVAQQAKGMEVLTAQLKEQAAQIQKVSAQIEMVKPAPQVVVNKP